MDISALQTLWSYNAWAMEQILAAAAKLPEQALDQMIDSGHGSLYDTLLHILDTEYGWRMLIEGGVETPVLTRQDVPDLATLTARAHAESQAWHSYLAGLSDDDLGQPARYVVGDQTREPVRWHIVYHVLNHGSYHRGEVAAALSARGQSPGELDFMIFVRR
jgi:uncharacterized damage-inducible protein DinB